MILSKIIKNNDDNLDNFIREIKIEASIIDSARGFKLINISFIDSNTAVIFYKQLELY